MKKLAKVVAGLAGAYLALMLISGLALKVLLSGSRVQTLLSSFQSRVPVPVSVGGGEFDLAQWFLFRPSIALQDLSIGNPPGFSPHPMLEARKVSAQIALLSLLRDPIDIRSFTLHQPDLRIERGKNGRANLEVLFAALSGPEESPDASERTGEPAGPSLSIRRFSIESGAVRFIEPGKDTPSLSLRDIDLALEDFSRDKTCRMALAARLFEGPSSRLEFKGRAGPAREESLPAQGEFLVELAPAEMPPTLRAEYFGDFLRDPGDGSRVALRTSMQGDLVSVSQGEGRLTVSDLQLGRDKEHQLALIGEAPLRITLRRPVTSPAFELLTENASLQLGQGRWNGRTEVSFDGSRFRGESSGAITGVRIEEMLDAFTSAGNAVFGRAEIPEYRLQFSGENAQNMRDSLTGQGRINLEEGRIAIFDLLGTIQQQLKRVTTGEAAAQQETSFTRLSARVEIKHRQLLVPELALEHPATEVSGQGSVGFDQSLNFDLITSLTGDLAGRLGGKPDSSGVAQLRVPVRVRGSVNSPKLYPDVGRMVKQKAIEKATGLLDSLLKKRTKDEQ